MFSFGSNHTVRMPGQEKAMVVCEDFPSLQSIRRAIPAHCFESSLTHSVAYVVRDLLIVALLFGGMNLADSFLESPARKLAWCSYWFLQGTLFWAIFVLGHDCGHNSFSRYKPINAIFGNILHSFLLVPFRPWALSHRHHHLHTGNIAKDEPFVPEIGDRQRWGIKQSSKVHLLRRFGGVFLGLLWFLYLACFSNKLSSHFWPGDPMFKGQRLSSFLSIGCVGLMLGVLAAACKAFGVQAVLAYYFIPLFVFASWLVFTTFLHHNHPDVPWYSAEEWSFVKGNISTIDRSYGIFDHLVHNIGTHQIHHVFIYIPHYHLKEATLHFRKAFPHLARYSYRSVWRAYGKSLSDYCWHGHKAQPARNFTYRKVKK